MGTESLMSWDGSTGSCEHDVIINLSGNLETVRQRLILALEKLEYTILEEQPLFAKREARNGGVTGTSANVLDYQSKLFIGLKDNKDGQIRATFSYRIKHPLLSKGDYRTLDREAEALCALTRDHNISTNCSVCGTEGTNDSRFCRRCGTPVSSGLPAELEVLHITSKSMAAFEFIRIGAVMTGIALVIFFISMIPTLAPKAAHVLHIIGAVMSSFILLIVHGLRQLHSAIHNKPKQIVQDKASAAQDRPPKQVSVRDIYKTGELSLPASPPSVTEHTTMILEKETDPLPVRREREQERY